VVFLQGFVAEFNGVFDSITKTEMAGDVKFYGSEIQNGGRKVLFTKVFQSPGFFYSAGDRRPVVGWDIELFDIRFF